MLHNKIHQFSINKLWISDMYRARSMKIIRFALEGAGLSIKTILFKNFPDMAESSEQINKKTEV